MKTSSLLQKWAGLALALPMCFATSSRADFLSGDGVIGYWSGDGNALDLSSQHNNGSFTGGSYAPGHAPGTLAFNLLTAKVSMPDIPAYDFTSYDGWSVGFWFNANGQSMAQPVFLGQDNGSGFRPKWFVDYAYTVFGNNNRFNFHVNDFNGERIFVGSDSVTDLTGWHQLTITIDNLNSGQVDFYYDGDAIGTAYMGNYVLQPTAPLILGFAEGFRFDGLMSDVFLMDRVLSEQEISDYVSGVPETNTVGVVAFAGICGTVIARKRKLRTTSIAG